MAAADSDEFPIRSPGPSFSVGRCVADTLTTWLRNAPAFAVVSAACEVPIFVVIRFLLRRPPTPTIGSVAVSMFLFVLLFFSWNLTFAAVTLGVVESRQGRRPTIRRCLRVTVRASPTLLAIALRTIGRIMPAFMAAGFGFGIVSAIASFDHATRGRSAAEVAWMYALTGIAVLWCLTRIGVAGPAAVVEGLRGRDAMARSRALTEGRRWAVGAAFFLLGVLPLAGSVWLRMEESGRTGAWYQSATWRWTHTLLGWTVVSPLIATLVATIYHALRRDRDGVDSEVLADVFA